MLATLINSIPARDKKIKIIFICDDELGTTFGPFVEHVDENSNIQHFIDTYASSLLSALISS